MVQKSILKSPKSTKLENWEGFKKWRALQKLSKNETGLEGGRYKKATQCLRALLGVHKETAKNSNSLGPDNNTLDEIAL